MAHKQVTHEDVERWFTYQVPTDEQIVDMTRVREAAKVTAHTIVENVPDGPSKTKAIQDLREVVMRANLGIMFEGDEPSHIAQHLVAEQSKTKSL